MHQPQLCFERLFVARIFLVSVLVLLASPAHALSLNSFRAEHKLPPLTYSALLTGAAYGHAQDLARRKTLDHKGFKARVMSIVSSAGAENVSFGCETEDCAIAQWAKSPGHRANMLLKGISSYGIASAKGDDGRTYWVMVVGN